MDVATWNVNSLRVRLDHLQRWSASAAPNVICLQETKTEDKSFPLAEVQAMGFEHVAIWGQKTYNGVAILSKHPLTDVRKGWSDGDPDPQARVISAVVQGVRVVCCYVPNGNRVGSDKFRYKLRWLAQLRRELSALGTADDDILVCGDINIAPSDDDVWDPFEADGQLLFHPKEHRALSKITAWGLHDALRKAHPTGRHFSWWDFRGAGFQRNRGYRIDHLYLTASLLQRCTDVVTYRDVRGWERPSDHVPVVACLR